MDVVEISKNTICRNLPSKKLLDEEETRSAINKYRNFNFKISISKIVLALKLTIPHAVTSL